MSYILKLPESIVEKTIGWLKVVTKGDVIWLINSWQLNPFLFIICNWRTDAIDPIVFDNQSVAISQRRSNLKIFI